MTAPPRLAERALAAAVRDPEWRDAIVGDLREEFLIMTARHGGSHARRWYWAQAIGVAAHRVARLSRPRRTAPLPLPEPPASGRLPRLAHDLRSAWRSLRQQPALSATVIVVLALGLAANATIFALADAIVLRPFRYPGVTRAVVVASDEHERFFDRSSVAPADFLDWRDQAGDVIETVAAIEWWDPQYLPDGPPQQLAGFLVSPALFEIIGEPAVRGRTLRASDSDAPERVAVISEDFWQRQLGGRDDVLGTRLRLAGDSYAVVGVMPGRFRVPFGADVWAPLRFTPETSAERRRGYLMVVGRLAAGVEPPQAEARLQAILREQRRAFPESHARRGVSVYTFTEGFGDPGAGPFIGVFQIAAVVLLLVACANVANLLLARNSEREREFAVRLALGASGGRLAWQLLLEGALLSAAAVALALPFAWAALGATRVSFPSSVVRFVPGWSHMALDLPAFAVTAALAAAAVFLFGTAPAVRAARQSVTAGLRIGSRLTDTAIRQRGRAVLASAQLALTLALLVGAGLSLAALHRVTEGPLGFRSDNVLVGQVSLPSDRYAEPARRRQLVDRVLARLGALPAVTSAGVTSVLPYSGSDSSIRFWREDVPPRERDAAQVATRSVTPSTLSALHVPLRAGRLLDHTDREDSVPVAVVSESLAARFWPGQPALGQRFRTDPDGPLISVVGVVGDVAQHWLVDPIRPTFYRPFEQVATESFHIIARTVAEPTQLAAGLRAAVQAEDPELPVVAVRSMEGVIEDQTAGLRFAGRTLGVIAIVSGVLAAVGLYSLMAFLTGRRTREMGVRMALGATSGDVVRLTCGQALRLTAAGIGAGLVLSFFVGRGLEAAMFGVVASSAPLVLTLAAALAATALAASYVPARRAARVEPTVALRAE